MKYNNFGHLTQAQQLAVVLGADFEASMGDDWIPGNRCIASNKTVFRIAPKNHPLEVEAKDLLHRRWILSNLEG